MWAVVEIMGRRAYAGLVSETELAGAKLIKVEVPEVPAEAGIPGIPAFFKLFSPSALYGITPCTEDEARRWAANRRETHISSWEIQDRRPLRLTTRDSEEAEEVPADPPAREVDEDDIPFDRDADGEPYAAETPGRL